MKQIVLVLCILVLCVSPTGRAQQLLLDHVEGLWQSSTDSLVVDGNTPITFYLRLHSGEYTYQYIRNGFRFYSEDSLEWSVPDADTVLSDWKLFSNLSVFTIYTDALDGVSPDTIGFGGASFISGNGLPPNIDTIVYRIRLDPFPIGQNYHSKQLCLDSAFYGIDGYWVWRTTSAVDIIPDWFGPYCFTLVEPELSVISDYQPLPLKVSLAQNYPNPFNPSTRIEFSLKQPTTISLVIYNINGQTVSTLFSGNLSAGDHAVEWDGLDDDGRQVSSGIYLYQLTSGETTCSRKMMFIR